MPRSQKGHTYILYLIDKVTNYLITVPIHQSKSEEISDTLITTLLKNIVYQKILKTSIIY